VVLGGVRLLLGKSSTSEDAARVRIARLKAQHPRRDHEVGGAA